MHAATLHVIRTARRPLSRLACQIVVGVRYRYPPQQPLFRHTFHASPAFYRIPEDPSISSKGEVEGTEPANRANQAAESEEIEQDGTGVDGAKPAADEEETETEPSGNGNGNNLIARSRLRRNGPGRTRSTQPRLPEGLPPITLPDLFLSQNVSLLEDLPYWPATGLTVWRDTAVQVEYGVENETEATGDTGPAVGDDVEGKVEAILEGEPTDDAGGEKKIEAADNAEVPINNLSEALTTDKSQGPVPEEGKRYCIQADVYTEILSTMRTGLTLRPPKNLESPAISRPITHLQCPTDDGSYYLDAVVKKIASELKSDLVCLDAQDIAHIVGSYIDETAGWTPSNTAVLGYETHKVAGALEEFEDDPANVIEEDAADFGTPEYFRARAMRAIMDRGRNNKNSSKTSSIFEPFTIPNIAISMSSNDLQLPTNQAADGDWNSLKITAVLNAMVDAAENKRALKVTAALDALVDAAENKRTVPSTENPDTAGLSLDKPSQGTIIQIRDYKALSGTTRGPELLSKLRTTINKRWMDGKNIICVGTSSIVDENESALSKSGIQRLQSDILEDEKDKRTIFVPTQRKEEQDVIFETDEKARIRNINLRHIKNMIETLTEGTADLTHILDLETDLSVEAIESSGLEDAVWMYSRVHRLAMTVLGLGLEPSISVIDGCILGKALEILSSSDDVKFAWGAQELKELKELKAKEEEKEKDVMSSENETNPLQKNDMTKSKLRMIKKNCTPHEKKLLGGVVMPSEIQTTFNDIRAPQETVDALKTLTSLSLIRPEAFSYGVLAADKIPGLLLYGPSGTGKTLLAKAVAKESGATVLEISGADINDMFVGEGEKNVKAVFSLAKKLSPCVVFIDEADAIFSSRGNSKPRGSTHREIITQFLREWDGMRDLSAFIMVATNRPFDLDEAVLRRLPRRLLVDLPVEKDREAILKIHLKCEILDESVSLSELAKETTFYSGSDLKNVSVAAALACIREENENALKHTGDEPYVYPEKRILTQKHFDKALEEISASISEDMSTLIAVRKFDEKYGDRKGRRKKSSALGFGGTTIAEKDSESARVRKIETA